MIHHNFQLIIWCKRKSDFLEYGNHLFKASKLKAEEVGSIRSKTQNAGDYTRISNAGNLSSFWRQSANNYSEWTDIKYTDKRHINHNGSTPHPSTHSNLHNKGLLYPVPTRFVRFDLWVCMHMRARRNPCVLSFQGLICLHYHHTAAGRRSVRAHGNCTASVPQ